MNFHNAAPSTKLPMRISNIIPFITCTTIILTLVCLHHPSSIGYSTSFLVSNLPSPSYETFQKSTAPSKTRVGSSVYSNDSDPNPIIQQNDTTKSSPPDGNDYNLANVEKAEDGEKTPEKYVDVNIVNEHHYDDKECDLFSGEWLPNPNGPYYTNVTCWTIQEHQNCMKYGRPNEEFLKWRWKPYGCDLAVFDPLRFLGYMRGKSLAFVGDSVARNHMQSLLCLLSRVANPLDVSNTADENFKHWHYKDYNFNISIFWSPYLVNTQRTDPNDISRPFNLYLDEFDESWTTKIETFDYVIISAGQWFSRPAMFYMQGRFIGCLYCPDNNVTHLTSQFSLRLAFQTAFKAVNSLRNYKAVTFLRTITTSHFENGEWNKGGNCPRTRPYRIGEIVLEDYNLDMYNIQLEEFKIARDIGRLKGLKFRLFDVTQIMLLRPDGHPDKYGPWPTPRNAISERSDCVHWCLPGPIDTWNDFLLEMLRRDKIAELL